MHLRGTREGESRLTGEGSGLNGFRWMDPAKRVLSPKFPNDEFIVGSSW